MGERVVVAMSGGVDSSVSAALVLEQGYEAVGVTMQLAGSASRCCSLADADDARQVAERLGIRFFVANYADRFRKEVMEEFADAYLAGRTPIPCVACNTRFKFHYLLERAAAFGAERVATGHYARIELDERTGLRQLLRSRHVEKDQSYFLFQLDQQQLARAWFPLGAMSKQEVRERARGLGLATAEKAESQEICFVPDGDYRSVVERIRPEAAASGGEIVDESGQALGRHPGVHHFTVGQRHGLGIGDANRRLYVQRIDAARQRVVVGDVSGLDCREALVEEVHWIAGTAPEGAVSARVQVRHRHRGALAKVEAAGDGRARVYFEEPVRAVSPGQAAVFYDAERDEAVLGGGWIAGTPQ